MIQLQPLKSSEAGLEKKGKELRPNNVHTVTQKREKFKLK